MKEKQLKDYLNKINLSSKEEPVLMGEITLAINVIKRVKHQSPGTYEKVLDMIVE